MSTGAERAEAPHGAIHNAGGTEPDWLGPAELQPEDTGPEASADASREPRSIGVRIFGILLVLLALGWLGAFGWSVWPSAPEPSLPLIVSWIATASVPLVLLGLLWLLFGRSGRRETERFARAVEAMRAESTALESVLGIVATRLEENHARLRGEAEKLMSLGDEASDRLGRAAQYLSKESADLNRTATALDAAAAGAKVDVGVLLHDLPKAEQQARAVAEAMKEAGLTAHMQAGKLEAQLGALAARGREADELLGSSAQRLAAQVARIESGSAAAAATIGEASAGMTAAVDGAMERATEALDGARSGLEAQAAAMLAAIDQSRAALDKAGEDAARNLGQRLEIVSVKIGDLAGHLSAQDAASQALLTRLEKELAGLGERFAQLGRTGEEEAGRLANSVQAVRDGTRALLEELEGGSGSAEALIGRARELDDALGSISGQLADRIPAALDEVEGRAGRARGAMEELAPLVEGLESSTAAMAARLAEADSSAVRQREAFDALIARIDEGVRQSEAQLRALGEAAGEAEGAAGRLVSETGPELIDALLRVRETAAQAAERAREAISAVIPTSAAALAKASGEALSLAVSETVERQMGELSAVSERALRTAREASERLTRQMLAIGETAAAIEARIDEARREREEKEAENLSRRVALLIESLNSTAIDVTKILSNDVTDGAWAAYLKGDRGVFTRRAVRLLETAEAREIARHYEEEPEFREQVNRYIHDFESMLRRVLADRDGSPLGVTLLSSDMGKLYVALAQAIERLR